MICRFQYSGAAVALVAAPALATLAVIAITPGALALRILAATWTVGAALEAAHRVALRRGRNGVRILMVRRSGGIMLRNAEGVWTNGALRDGSFVAPWLTLVRWRPEGARVDRTVLILPGMVGAEEFRRLRVLLRWG